MGGKYTSSQLQNDIMDQVHAPNTWLDGEPPKQYFMWAPTNTPAYFSTESGRRARRFISELPPERIIFPWSHEQILSAVKHIGEHSYKEWKRIQKPTNYAELFIYWDSLDLWHMGVQNAWNILSTMYQRTQERLPTLLARIRPVLSEWCRKLLHDQSLRQKLFYWNRAEKPHILDVFSGTEQASLKNIDSWYIAEICKVLEDAHVALCTGPWQDFVCQQSSASSLSKYFSGCEFNSRQGHC